MTNREVRLGTGVIWRQQKAKTTFPKPVALKSRLGIK